MNESLNRPRNGSPRCAAVARKRFAADEPIG